MHSTLLWYYNPDESRCNNLYGQTVDGIPVEYVSRDGKLYAERLLSTNPRHYLDGCVVPGCCIEIDN